MNLMGRAWDDNKIGPPWYEHPSRIPSITTVIADEGNYLNTELILCNGDLLNNHAEEVVPCLTLCRVIFESDNNDLLQFQISMPKLSVTRNA